MALAYISLRTDRKNKKGEYPVCIKFNLKGRTIPRGLGITVTENQWDEKKLQVRSAHPYSMRFNQIIARKLSRVNDYILSCEAEGMEVTLTGVDEALAGRALGSYFTVADKEIERLKYHCSFEHYKKFEEIINGFREFCGGDISLGKIDREFLNSYILHLKSKGNGANTIAKKISTIRTPFLTAFNDGLVRENPFHGIKTRFEEPEKDVPGIDLVKALRDVDLRPGTWEWHARNAWVFAYYMHGMRFTDICLFKRRQAREGKYSMHKNGKTVIFRITPEIQAILDRYPDGDYLFPFLNRDYEVAHRDKERAFEERKALRDAIGVVAAQCNKHLKSAGLKAFRNLLTDTVKAGGSAEDVGDPIMLTMHMARSAFSEHVRDMTKDVRAAQQLLKHSSLNTTQKYFDKKRLNGQQQITDELFSLLR